MVVTQDGLAVDVDLDGVCLVEFHVGGAQELVQRGEAQFVGTVFVEGDVLLVIAVSCPCHEAELRVQHHDGVAEQLRRGFRHLGEVRRRLDNLVQAFIPAVVPVEDAGDQVHDGERVRLLLQTDEAAPVQIVLDHRRVARADDDGALLELQVPRELVSRQDVEVVCLHGLGRVQKELRTAQAEAGGMIARQLCRYGLIDVFIQNVCIESHEQPLLL